MKWENWNKLIKCNCNKIFYPKTENELRNIIKISKKVRVIGNGKSSHNITTCDDLMFYNNS